MQSSAYVSKMLHPARRNSPLTALSKRILGWVSEYETPLMGTLAVSEIGLDTIRWLTNEAITKDGSADTCPA